jgi:hypothetical protein
MVRHYIDGWSYWDIDISWRRFHVGVQWAWPNCAVGARLFLSDDHGRVRPWLNVELLSLNLSVGLL